MNKFLEMDLLINGNGERITVEEAKAKDPSFLGVFKNDKYQVLKNLLKSEMDPKMNIIWLSIKRIDKEPIHDWRDLQEIKNQLVGEENEGLEMYPAESRVVDSANQYHLWVFENPEFRFPFGFRERFVNADEPKPGELGYGAKQRPFEPT
jgi:hypothetical protein